MISLFFIALLVLSLAILLPVMNVIANELLITSGLVIDPDFHSWTCNRCYLEIEGENREVLTNNVRVHLKRKHSLFGKLV